jgi:hemerythrin-like domain-containing protein
MMLLKRLRRDHANLNRLLDLLSRELDAFFAGDESDFDLKIEMLDYIEHYAEKTHHPMEDLIFEAAMARDEMVRPLFERLRKEHHELEGMARRYRNTLEGIVQGEVITREEVGTRGREFVALQRHHIKVEDEEVLPLLEGLFSEEEWEELAARVPDDNDPVFNRQDYNRFHSLIDYLQSH